ncbi:ABC transporter permease [Desulfonema ishimotonii]|uniref:ABC transporter permease n=1 Tax=Desulfonema ishimotonii TaxID=45657 RepID=A0A401FSX1_9BACT|nr:lipoprotein-releasing ABC transporter permease subunit [Desulfonema ishimotonii]GBC60055.1 ABC transporter permease [Desulfonema ishimotonii]
MAFEFFIGRRYLRAKQKQAFISLITLLSVAGVSVGVMALIVVIAVMAGFEDDLKSRILGVESHLVLERREGHFRDYPRIMTYLQGVEGVASVTPFVDTQAMIRTTGGVAGAVLRGVDPETVGLVIPYFDPLSLKSLAEGERDSRTVSGIVLGRELARTLGVLEGDDLYLISPRGMVSPVGHIPAMRRFRVAGLFSSGMYEYDGTLAYIHIDAARKFLRMGDAVSGLDLRLADIYRAGDIGRQIISDLGDAYVTRDWMQMNKNFFSALRLEKSAMFVILTLIILVAAFNIASSLIMMVMEKKRDIAILKAMGATDRSIRRIFVFKGVVIGTVGTILGVMSGTLLCFLLKRYEFISLPSEVYYITTLPVLLKATDVCLIGAAALFICLLATLYPAYLAARTNPAEALRYG